MFHNQLFHMAAGLEITKQSMRGFQSALRTYEKATGKDAADVLNRGVKNTLFKAFRLTRQARVGQIRRWDPARTTRSSRMLYALLTKQGRSKKGEGLQAAVEKEFKQRMSARGSLRAGWLPALRAFGGMTRARQFRGSQDGTGRKAVASRLVAEFTNVAGDEESAAKILFPVANQAIEAAAQDMTQYAQRKMQQSANRVSAR